MDWLRRNWPDLLIGVALVAVIAGIIATLISGGSFFPVGQGELTDSPPAQSGPSTAGGSTGSSVTPSPDAATIGQGADAAAVSVDAPAAVTGADGTGAVTPSGPDSSVGSAVSALPPGGDAPVTPTPSSDTAVAVPLSDPAPSATDTASSQPSTSPAAAGSPATALPPAAAVAPAAVAAPAAAGTPIGASAGTDEASYRVAVGAFGNADNAQRHAQAFQASGYPVLLGTQGNLTIVLVGPYETEAEARRVAEAVRVGNFDVADPVVHRYEPEAGESPSAAGVAPAAGSASASPTTAPAAPAASAPSAASGSSGRYLQVGAYANRESSIPQRELLEEMGFSVSEDTEGSLLKLLVGPFQGSALSDAQSRLAAEGIENFAR